MKAKIPKGDISKNRRAVYEELWLRYYNDALHSRGIISERERNRMQNLIASSRAMSG